MLCVNIKKSCIPYLQRSFLDLNPVGEKLKFLFKISVGFFISAGDRVEAGANVRPSRFHVCLFPTCMNPCTTKTCFIRLNTTFSRRINLLLSASGVRGCFSSCAGGESSSADATERGVGIFLGYGAKMNNNKKKMFEKRLTCWLFFCSCVTLWFTLWSGVQITNKTSEL